MLFIAALVQDQGAVGERGTVLTLVGADEAERSPASPRPSAVTLHPSRGRRTNSARPPVTTESSTMPTAAGVGEPARRDERVCARHPRLKFSQEGGRLLGELAKAIPRSARRPRWAPAAP